ncbi:MAG: tRNA preQ1(34) S-adenosylmethionine ribosyltransferase-isomerase QueA [Thermoleophilia bacterium]|nr:tRNA preQ1(34) S-adenosylmethionine ribosyltransferase-isomerase QueA [Thermoleophilia bacterium]
MRTSELDYSLPPELVAQRPVTPRDRSRLLVYDRSSGRIDHSLLPDLAANLSPGDILVYNDSRVIRARLQAVKPGGGRVELLFLRRRSPRLWEALARPSSRLKTGSELGLDSPGQSGISGGARSGAAAGRLPTEKPGPSLRLEENLGGGRWLVRNMSLTPTEELLESRGEMPLPPYITEELREPERYQTVYAACPGSAAAPTAGLHFTRRLMDRIRDHGIGLFPLTLHIGLDTFRPVHEDDLSLHRIHSEYYRMPAATHKAVVRTRSRGGRVVAVGTTTARVLETVYREPGAALEGETGLFITPGYAFRAVDALLTNFHLPKSTLLAMVMAFAGIDETRGIYRQAIQARYRFYSFGDAMLVI